MSSRHSISILPCFYKQLNWKVGLPVAAISRDLSNWVIVEDASQAIESGSSWNLRAARLLPAKKSETTLLTLSSGSTILKLTGRVGLKLAAGWVAKVRKKSLHKERADDAHAQDSDHGVVALAVLARTGGGVLRPAGVESIGGHNTTQITQTGNESSSSSNSHFSVALLEDLGTPGHADWHRGTKTETNHEKTSVSSPAIASCQSSGKETSDLDTDGSREEVRARSVEAVRDRSNDENGDEIHNPDRREQQTDFDTAGFRSDGCDDNGSVHLGAYTNADNTEVHHCERPQTPIDKDKAKILEVPGARVVDTSKIVVVNNSVLSLENLRGSRKELPDTSLGASLTRRKRTIREPPQQNDAQNDTDKAINHKHPSEAHNASLTIHELKSSRNKTDNSSRDLRGGKVVPNSLTSSRRGIEQGEVESHARPHTSNNHSQQESQELDAPGIVDSSETSADNTGSKDNASHPETRAELAHDEVGRAVKEDIGNVEESQGGRNVLGSHSENSHEVMSLVLVHGLSDSNV
jgi:hypothetical protein